MKKMKYHCTTEKEDVTTAERRSQRDPFLHHSRMVLGAAGGRSTYSLQASWVWCNNHFGDHRLLPSLVCFEKNFTSGSDYKHKEHRSWLRSLLTISASVAPLKYLVSLLIISIDVSRLRFWQRKLHQNKKFVVVTWYQVFQWDTWSHLDHPKTIHQKGRDGTYLERWYVRCVWRWHWIKLVKSHVLEVFLRLFTQFLYGFLTGRSCLHSVNGSTFKSSRRIRNILVNFFLHTSLCFFLLSTTLSLTNF